jgi:thiamine biosynthesis lipoprotein
VVAILTAPPGTAADRGVLREERALSGTFYRIDVRAADPQVASAAISAAFAEIERLEGVISEWTATSEVSALNAAAGGPAILVSAELLAVLNRALWFSRATDGAFDVSFAACGDLWSIPDQRIPFSQELAACLPLVDYRSIELELTEGRARLGRPGMRLGLGAIGKGYRIDRAAEILERHGIRSYVVNGGGDILLRAAAGDPDWTVAIEHPHGGMLGQLQLRRGAIVTSGDWSWYFERDGLRYHHILDPATGYPARRSIAVTVIGETAMDADALATGLFVLGPERGLRVLATLPEFEALIVGPDRVLHASPGFPPLSPSATTPAKGAR